MSARRPAIARRPGIEWLTIAVIAATTVTWMAALWLAGQHGWWPMLGLAALCVTLHSSCQHEVLHGHPTRNRYINEALVCPAIGLFFPYRRFKALHLKHHNDPNLTDPYEDPETNYMAAADWDRLPDAVQRLRRVNNTLLGRLTIGPFIGIAGFLLSEFKLLLAGERPVILAWALHAAGVAIALWWMLIVCNVSFVAYVFAAAIPGYSLLILRTYLEHRAEERVPHRTCIVEDESGLFGLLFLNNNLHALHHERPALPWYDLPARYAAEKQRILAENGGYSFASYWQLAGRYLFRVKADVPHPFLRREP